MRFSFSRVALRRYAPPPNVNCQFWEVGDWSQALYQNRDIVRVFTNESGTEGRNINKTQKMGGSYEPPIMRVPHILLRIVLSFTFDKVTGLAIEFGAYCLER